MFKEMVSEEVNRQSSAIAKRCEQLRRWDQSETNRQSSHLKLARRVQFEESSIFLAACSEQDHEEIGRLLRKNVDINTTNIDGLTALHQASIDNNLQLVEYLIEKKANCNGQDNEGWTPLHAAAYCGNIQIVKCLLNHGAMVELCNNEGELPMDIAQGGEILLYLRNDMKKKGIDDQQSRNYEHQVMIEHAQDLNGLKSSSHSYVHPRTGATPLHVAAAKGYVDVLDLLLRAGVNINAVDYDGWTPLHAAAHWDKPQIIQYLLQKNADLNVKNDAGQTPMDVCNGDTLQILKEWKDKHTFVNEEIGLKRKSLSPRTNDEQKSLLRSQSHNESLNMINKPPSQEKLTNLQRSLHDLSNRYTDESLRQSVDGWSSLLNGSRRSSTSLIVNRENGPTPSLDCQRWETNDRREESEAQRKHRSSQARRERRLTQSVTQEDIRAAEQKIENYPTESFSRNPIGAPSTFSLEIEKKSRLTLTEDLPMITANDSINLPESRRRIQRLHNQRKQTGKMIWNDETKEIEVQEDSNSNGVDSTINKFYEETKRQMEELSLKVKRLEREIRERDQIIDKLKTSQYIESSFDKREKRTYERKICELDEELKKMDSIKADNIRLKEENGALIRVISKLSK